MLSYIKIELGRKVAKLIIGEKHVISFEIPKGDSKPSLIMKNGTIELSLNEQSLELILEREEKKIRIIKKLGLKEKVLGFGGKALPLNKRRVILSFWNYDQYGYSYYDDPLYISIPFTIFVDEGKAIGLFINSPALAIADIGLSEYDKFKYEIQDNKCEIFVIFGPKISNVLETYLEITGKPFLPPQWALGYQISRYSYFPQDYVLEIAKNFNSEIPISAIYLDIDYMERYKIFTWSKERFPNPNKMIKELHELGIKVIPIIDPYIKVEDNYEIYEEAKDLCIKDSNGKNYITIGWPGHCLIPDFLNEETRKWWSKKIEDFVKKYDLDGIWLDMNEPSVFTYKIIIEDLSSKFGLSQDLKSIINRLVNVLGEKRGLKANKLKSVSPEDFFDLSIDPNALHHLGENFKIEHKYVRNAYPYFQAKATYEALKRIHERPFVLSRSGYAGIQSYAAIWTGDVPSTWEGLRLTLSMLLNLSLSGIIFCGCDLGGFVGRGDYELIARWHQACLFIPFYRLHKDKAATEAEIFNMPSYYKEMIKRAVETRLKFLPYLWHLCWEAHLKGKPIIRPLCYDFQDDEDCYYIEDEYMVGSGLLFAPIIEHNTKTREVYLPNAKWFDYWNGEIHEGKKLIETRNELPIFIKEGSVIPTKEELIIFGKGEWEIYTGEDGKILRISYNGNKFLQKGEGKKFKKILFLGEKLKSKGVEVKHDKLGTYIEFREDIEEISFD